MADVILRPVTEADVADLIAHLREGDRRELEAGGRGVEAAVRLSLDRSTHTFAAEVAGELIAVGGIGPQSFLSGIGVPWLLTTSRLYRHQRAFIRACRVYLPAMQRLYPRLTNFVDARYSAAVHWLRWLGFTVEVDKPRLVGSVPFYRFTLGD